VLSIVHKILYEPFLSTELMARAEGQLVCCCNCRCSQPFVDEGAAAQPLLEWYVLHHELKNPVWKGVED
jgi:hypothetical protein